MTSKQRAFLRSVSNNLDSNFQIGKNNITDNIIIQLDEDLESKELIKVNVLKTCDTPIKDVANLLALKTDSFVVSVVGRKFVLYRKSHKLTQEGSSLELPK